MASWPDRRPTDDPARAVAVDWCRMVRQLQLILGDDWADHTSKLAQRSDDGERCVTRVASLLRSVWGLVDDAARELITLTLWHDLEPEELLTPFDPATLTREDMTRLIEMSNGLFRADAGILASDSWVPVADPVREGENLDWSPALASRWSDPELVDRIVAVLFEDFMAVSDDMALAFADGYAFVSVTPFDDRGLQVTFLMSRRGVDWRVLSWPSQLFRWAPASKRRGEGGEGAGVREPRIPVVPAASDQATRSWPPEPNG